MDRSTTPYSCRPCRVPHGCGDGPPASTVFAHLMLRSPRVWGWTICSRARRTAPLRSPRVWGWTGAGLHHVLRQIAFPTGVGMDRARTPGSPPSGGVPHGCGDGPLWEPSKLQDPSRSPRVWGWTGFDAAVVGVACAFPTGVGMDRRAAVQRVRHWRVPHGCGDGPHPRIGVDLPFERSPRVWGWTAGQRVDDRRAGAFPTGVGMDRSPQVTFWAGFSVPHGCGDGPTHAAVALAYVLRSPRVWGWTAHAPAERPGRFAFPTGVGMDRLREGEASEAPGAFPTGVGMDRPRASRPGR